MMEIKYDNNVVNENHYLIHQYSFYLTDEIKEDKNKTKTIELASVNIFCNLIIDNPILDVKTYIYKIPNEDTSIFVSSTIGDIYDYNIKLRLDVNVYKKAHIASNKRLYKSYNIVILKSGEVIVNETE